MGVCDSVDIYYTIFPFTDGWCIACLCVCLCVYLCSCVLPKVDSIKKVVYYSLLIFFFCWQRLMTTFIAFSTPINL